MALVESLEAAVKKLSWKSTSTEWADYYNITNYTDAAFEHKRELLDRWISDRKPGLVWDMGANMGLFSRVASDKAFFTVSSDVDPAAVEQNYLQQKSKQEKDILPLLIDLTNPSPDLGWANRERDSFVARGPADLVMALALIHHLAISNNVPLPQLADFFAGIGRSLIIEFIPKSDSQVQKLLVTRADIFPNYIVEQFEMSFSKRFRILEKSPVRQSERILYLMEAK
jgi:hypothetical protein